MSEHTKAIYLRAFDCICQKCNHRFEGLDFPDAQYGRRILRTKGGKHLVLLDVGENEDKVIEEFSSILEAITGPLSTRPFLSLFDKTFGIACDPVQGEPIDASQRQVCPSCGSDALKTFDIVPMKAVLTRVYRIGHALWETKSKTEKQAAIRSALGE